MIDKLPELEGYLVDLVAGYSFNNFSCYVFHFHISIIIAHSKISQVLRFLLTLYDRLALIAEGASDKSLLVHRQFSLGRDLRTDLDS